MTQTTELEKKYICAIEENTTILCERHAQAFEQAAMAMNTPHTIYEMDDEDTIGVKCHACNLQDELNRPKIIMPGEF